jgi:single-strand DNA-binding protein
MSGFAEITLAGKVAKEPEMRYTSGGKPVTNFSIPVSEKKDGPTQWFRVACWEKMAETVATYVHKGAVVLVKGRVSARAYTDHNGETQAALEVTAGNVKFLTFADGDSGGDASSGGDRGGYGDDEDSAPF